MFCLVFRTVMRSVVDCLVPPLSISPHDLFRRKVYARSSSSSLTLRNQTKRPNLPSKALDIFSEGST